MPFDDEQRLATLHAYGVLDTAPDPALDELTRLAAALFATPTALVSLVDRNRQWFKSRVGLELAQTPRADAICDTAIRSDQVLVVNDAQNDARFASNPLVTGPPGIRFYAGAPIRVQDDQALGTLCIIDYQPREFTDAQKSALSVLARQAGAHLELCRRNDLLAALARDLSEERDALKQAHAQIERNDQQMRAVVAQTTDAWWEINFETGQSYYSPAGLEMLGRTGEEVPTDMRLWDLLNEPEELQRQLARVKEAVDRGRNHFAYETFLRHRDGRRVPILARAFISRDASGKAIRIAGTDTDLTKRNAALRALQGEQQFNEQIFAHSPIGIQIYDSGGNCVAVNQAMARTVGGTVEELRRQNIHRVASWKKSGILELALKTLHTGEATSGVHRIQTSFGKDMWMMVNFRSLPEGSVGRLMLMVDDMTEFKRAEANTHKLAYFDSLTDLPNRAQLLDRIGQSLEASRRSGQLGALLFLDLDNFKRINDARGHSVGDGLLVRVAHRLTELLRPGDLVARLGGDEFVVLVNDLGHNREAASHAAMAVAERARKVMETPCLIDGWLYSGTGSIGVTVFPNGDSSVDDLLREADTAMYRAKEMGRNRIAYFESAMQEQVEERLALEHDLKEAIDTEQITVSIQPQVSQTRQQVGGELLLRWNHPRRGAVSPATFIPIAEESGLILRLGDLVVQRACEAVARLARAGRTHSLSVNISPRQFRQDDFVEKVKAVLQQTQAPATQIVFEVTEGLLIEDWQNVASRMAELTRLGIRFSIDDFGTGYSSLGYLKKLPLHEIKIDKSFVQDTPDDPNDTAIVRSILAMAKHFKLQVVAEGVETEAQAGFLMALQCDFLQGFLFARPQPLENWLAQQLPVTAGG